MTLAAWVRPTEAQAGWRTILHRQTDAYFLTASGGGAHERLAAFDRLRLAALILATIWLCLVVGAGRGRWIAGERRSWWPPVALFLAGSLVDAALAPAAVLVGPILVAIWLAVTAADRVEAAAMCLLAAVFTATSIGSLADAVERTGADGSVARSAALGVLLVCVGLLGARRAWRWGPRRECEDLRRPTLSRRRSANVWPSGVSLGDDALGGGGPVDAESGVVPAHAARPPPARSGGTSRRGPRCRRRASGSPGRTPAGRRRAVRSVRSSSVPSHSFRVGEPGRRSTMTRKIDPAVHRTSLTSAVWRLLVVQTPQRVAPWALDRAALDDRASADRAQRTPARRRCGPGSRARPRGARRRSGRRRRAESG